MNKSHKNILAAILVVFVLSGLVAAATTVVSDISITADRLYTDNVSEQTAGAGIMVDGVLIMDGTIAGAYLPDAVMRSLYDPYSIIFATSDNTPVALTVAEQTLVGRITAGTIAALSAGQVRTLLNVADGATKYPDTGEQAFLDADHTKLDGVKAGATTDQTGAEIKTAYQAEANAYTDTKNTKLSGIETAADVTDAVNIASSTHGVAAKTTPVDADELGLVDSEAANALKKMTWVDLKAAMKTYFDTQYAALPVIYGVSWDESANTYARTGTLDGVACGSSPGNSVLPIQADMCRCVLSDAGVVQYYLNSTDSTKKVDGSAAVLTGADGQVMVEIPAFYYRHTYVGTTHTWEVSTGSASGFSLHPAFTKNGVEVAYRYIGAYEGSMWDASTTAMVPSGSITTDMYAAGDKLCSLSGEYAKTYEMRSEFRAMGTSRGTGWRQLDFDLNSAVQLLYLIEYADFDSQTTIGMGRTQLSGGSWAADSYIGQCGKSNGDGDGTNSVAGNTNDAYMTYRGIENWYGNVWKWNDGININNNIPYVTNNDGAWADDTSTGYTNLSITLANANNYQLTLVDTNRGFLPASVSADATYVSDYYYQSTGWRVVGLGGGADAAECAGAFCVGAYGAASRSGAGISGRLAY